MSRWKIRRNLSMAMAVILVTSLSGCGQSSDEWSRGKNAVSQIESESGEKITEKESSVAAESEQVPPPVIISDSASSVVDEAERKLTFPADMPSEFSFSSGAGGWSTDIFLRPDGSFIGSFSDSDLGTTGDDYPYGTVYYCNFSGQLEVTEQLDEYSYALKLSSMEAEKGEEYISDEVRYVPSEPYGMEKGKDFVLYLPDTPLERLCEEFLLWWPGRYDMDEQEPTTLGRYGLYNRETEYGFFSEKE